MDGAAATDTMRTNDVDGVTTPRDSVQGKLKRANGKTGKTPRAARQASHVRTYRGAKSEEAQARGGSKEGQRLVLLTTSQQKELNSHSNNDGDRQAGGSVSHSKSHSVVWTRGRCYE